MRLSEARAGQLVQRIDTLQVGLKGGPCGETDEVYLLGDDFSSSYDEWDRNLLVRALDLTEMAKEMQELEARDSLVRRYLAATIMQYGDRLGDDQGVILSERMLNLVKTMHLDHQKDGTDTLVSVRVSSGE